MKFFRARTCVTAALLPFALPAAAIFEPTLELFDSAGTRLARLEAV